MTDTTLPTDPVEVLKRQGRAVRRRRKALGKTQSWLGQRAGCSQRQISSIEQGETQPSLQMRLHIAAALESKHDDLFAVDEAVA